MEKEVKINELTHDDIVNIISLSFEGGSNYWLSSFDYPDKETYNKAKAKCLDIMEKDSICYEDVIAECLLAGDYIILREYDEEGDAEETEYKMYYETLKHGMELYLSSKYCNYKDDFSDCDAYDGDAILQFTLFGEVVYG